MSNKELEDFLNSIPGLQKSNAPRQGNGDIDVTSMLQQRIMNKMAQQSQQTGFINSNVDANFQTNNNCEKVFLKEGQKYYKFLPAKESPMPIAMYAGPIAGVAGKEFINKGARKYYLVENHNPIDLSNPDYSKMQILYAVEAPWIGTILVSEMAIIKQNNGPTILKG